MARKITEHKAMVRMEIPAGAPWRNKQVNGKRVLAQEEVTFTVTSTTDWGLWASLIRTSLDKMGATHPGLVIGFFLDLINGLPEDYRRGLMLGIANGHGVMIGPGDDEFHFTIEHPEMYPPLVTRQREDGLVIPEGIVLP